jgi:hypothetical protein
MQPEICPLQTKTRERKFLPDGLSSTARQQAHPLSDGYANHGPHLWQLNFHFITGNYLLRHLAHTFPRENKEKIWAFAPPEKNAETPVRPHRTYQRSLVPADK